MPSKSAAAFFRPRYPILSPRVLLRPFTEDDLEPLHDMQSQPEVARFVEMYRQPPSREQVCAALAWRMRNTALSQEGDALMLAVESKSRHVLVGEVILYWLDEQHRQGELGTIFNPRYHGQGLATEAVTEMLRLGFESLGLRRIIARCDVRNTPATRVVERIGMRREALLRDCSFVEEAWHSEYLYSILSAEWAGR